MSICEPHGAMSHQLTNFTLLCSSEIQTTIQKLEIVIMLKLMH